MRRLIHHVDLIVIDLSDAGPGAMSRNQLEALGYKFVELDLPPMVRDWCAGDSVLCLVEGRVKYSDRELWKQLKPFPGERVLESGIGSLLE